MKNNSGFAARAPLRIARTTLTAAALALAASGAHAQTGDSNITFPGKTLTGAFMHDPGNEAHKSTMFGKFFGGGRAEYFNVIAYDENGTRWLELKMESSLADMAKTPRTFTLRSRKGKPATAEIMYQNVGIICTANAGTVTVTAFGKVDGTVTGTLTGVEWNQPECVKALGGSGSFKVQRAVDFGS